MIRSLGHLANRRAARSALWRPLAFAFGLAVALGFAAAAPAQEAPTGAAASSAAETRKTEENSAAQAQEQRPRLRWTPFAQVQEVPAGSMVVCWGKILSVKAPDPGSRQPYSYYLQDRSGVMRVIIWQDTYNHVLDPQQYRDGLIMYVYGEVGEFKGQRQLEVKRPNHVKLAPNQNTVPSSAFVDSDEFEGDVYYPVSIGMLNIGTIGRKVRVKGTVKEYHPSPAPRIPTKVVLEDRTGAIEIVYWSEVSGVLPARLVPIKGQEWEAAGIVSEHSGTMQIKVLDPEMIGAEAGKTVSLGSRPVSAPRYY
ncbi:MAG: hypothetical protein RLY93_01910 [Sumerlaeia bacterium]